MKRVKTALLLIVGGFEARLLIMAVPRLPFHELDL